MTSYMTTEHGAHGILGLSSPWARGKVREPLRSELASLIPEGWTVGLAVAPNNGPCRVWVNHGPDVGLRFWLGYDAETHIRAAIDWIQMYVRFWQKVDRRQPDECWPWRGAARPRGYGNFYEGGGRAAPRYVPAYRTAYELSVGPIPAGLDLDHLCRTPACVNPAHLEPVTHRENMLRDQTVAAVNAAKTHCPRGHEYTDANTYRRRNSRECRQCIRDRKRVA